METIRSTVRLLSPNCFMVSVDLKDAYYHIPIHPEFQKYLRVAIKMGSRIIHLQYRAFPFWHHNSSSYLHKDCGRDGAHIREGGVFVPYLDDFLLIGESFSAVQAQLERTFWRIPVTPKRPLLTNI